MTHDVVTDAPSAPGAREGDQPSTARLIGLDLARGLAVFGMYAVHVGPAPSQDGVIGHRVRGEASLGGLYRGLANAGRKVPRDMSVTGVAGERWAEAVTPAVTAAGVPAHEMGSIAIDLLLERIKDSTAPPRHRLLMPAIILRSSTGPAS